MTDPQYATGQYNERGQTICGAKTRKGRPCPTTKLGPAGRCRMHNGWARSGVNAGQYKTGRYSKYLPDRVIARYEEAQNDTELLALKDEIALVDARVSDLLSRADRGEAASAWKALRKSYRELQISIRQQDGDRTASALVNLEEAVSQGYSDYMVWSEVMELIEARRRLVESERKRLVEMNQMITAEQLILLSGALLEAIRTRVDDPVTRTAIANDLRQLLSASTASRIDT